MATIAPLTYLRSWAFVASIIATRFMVDQCPFLLEALTLVDNNTFLFQQHFKAACDLLPPPICACFLSFEQFIEQQMVWLQDSILERLHHHTLSNILLDMISEAHRAQILSCSNLGAGASFMAPPIFLGFWLISLVFSITLQIWLGLARPSVVCHLWCVCTHPIDSIDIHFLHCVHGNEHTGTHDVVYDTFAVIVHDVCFHVGWEQLHALPSNTFNSFHRRIDIVFTKDGSCTLVNIIIANPTRADLLRRSCATQGFVTFDAIQAKK